MNEKLISIIIPAYNGEDTIKRCIESINSSNVEIIIVDDGSQDNTLNICKEYEMKNENIKVFHQKNKGQFSARNLGIKNSTGKYVMFMDCDDYYLDNTISRIQEIIEKYCEPDLIRFRYKKTPDGYLQYEYFNEHEKVIKKENFKEQVYPMFINGYMLNAIWTNCVKREVLYKIKLDDKTIKFGEDLLLNLEIFSNIDKAVFIEDVLYNYEYRSNSITNSTDEKKKLKKLEDCMDVYLNLYEYLLRWNMYNIENINIIKNRIKSEITKILEK